MTLPWPHLQWGGVERCKLLEKAQHPQEIGRSESQGCLEMTTQEALVNRM